MSKLNYVNALIGSENEPRYSNGNIYPVTASPWGMAHWCLQTSGGSNWFYNPRHRIFEGIRLTHQPSPWIGDYGQMLFNFTSGEVEGMYNTYSSFRREEAVISPDYLNVYALRYRTNIELCPTERGGVFKIKCEASLPAFEMIPFGEFEYSFDGKRTLTATEITGYRWGQRSVKEYFYIEFSEDVLSVADREGGGVRVCMAKGEYEVRVATGFIGGEQTEQNFKNELKDKSFETLRRDVTGVWEELLSRVELHGESDEVCKTFYSCLYRALLYPRKFYELGADGKVHHFNPDTESVCDGVFFTDNGFWDTYRTVYPLYSLIYPEVVPDMIEGFVNFYAETGYLPKWLSPGECGLMPGTLIEAVIADAAVKGLVRKDVLKRAYEGMMKNSLEYSGNDVQGRKLPEVYAELGYLPCDRITESVNNTLDCAYGDFCISQVARLLGDDEKAEFFLERSKNYKNIFNKKLGFMLGKRSDGSFEGEAGFSPYKWGGVNCEGSYWQNSFAVYHDIEGLAELYGGKEKMAQRLDELFAAPPVFEVGGYRQEIHEMSEMAAVDYGQMAISNQPSFHIPWLYTLLGQKEKAAYITQKLANEAFNSGAEGFPGDEDNGTTGGWYIFASLGFYPVCPGKDEYVLSAANVNATVKVGENFFTVKKGESFDGAVIKHADVVKGN